MKEEEEKKTSYTSDEYTPEIKRRKAQGREVILERCENCGYPKKLSGGTCYQCGYSFKVG